MSDLVERLRHWMPIDLEDARWMRNAAADRIEALEAEAGRLRAIVRVNLMRSCGASHAEIDAVLDPPALAPEQDK